MASSPQDQKSSGLFQPTSKSSKLDTRATASGRVEDSRLAPVGPSAHGNSAESHSAGASQLGSATHSTTPEDSYMGPFGRKPNGKPSSPHATFSTASVPTNYTSRPPHFAFPQPGSPTDFSSSAASGAHLLGNPPRSSGYPHQLPHNSRVPYGLGPSSINPPRYPGSFQQTDSQHSFPLPPSSKEPMSRVHGFSPENTPAHSAAKSSGSSVPSSHSLEQPVSPSKNNTNSGSNHAQRSSVGSLWSGQSRRSPILGDSDRETREKDHKEKEKITRSHIEVLNRPAYQSTPSSSPPIHTNSPKDALLLPAGSSQLPSSLPPPPSSLSSRPSVTLAPSARPQSGGDRREVIQLNAGSELNAVQAAGQPILERREPRPYGFSFHTPSSVNPTGPLPGAESSSSHKRSGGVKSASGSPVRVGYAPHSGVTSLPAPAMPNVVPAPVSRKYGLVHATSSIPPAPSSGAINSHSQPGHQHRRSSGNGGMKEIEPMDISPGLSNLSHQSSHSHQHTHHPHSHPLPLPPQHPYQHQHQSMISSTLLPPPPPPPAPPPSTILSNSSNTTSASSRKSKSHRYAVPPSVPSSNTTSSLLRPEFNPTFLSSVPNPTVRSPFLSSLPREVPYLGKFIYGGQGWILPSEVGEKAHELMRVPVGGGPARSVRGGLGGGGRVEVVIPSGFLGTGWTLKSKMGGGGNLVDGSPISGANGWNTLVDSIGKERSLWGTEVYTDDSDLVALLVHAGWIVPASENDNGNGRSDRIRAKTEAGSEVADEGREGDRFGGNGNGNGNGHSSNDSLWKENGALRVTLRVVGRLIRYIGTERNGVKSRGWGNGHDGGSLVVEGVTRVERTSRTSSLSRRTKKARMTQAIQLRNESIKEYNSAVVNLHVWGGAGFKYSQEGIQASFDNALYNAFAFFSPPTRNGSLVEGPDGFDTGFRCQDLYLENPDERYRLTLCASTESEQLTGTISPRLSIYVLPKRYITTRPSLRSLDPLVSSKQEQKAQRDVPMGSEGESKDEEKEEEELLGGSTVGPSDLEWVEMGLVVRDPSTSSSFSFAAAVTTLGNSTNGTGIEDQAEGGLGREGRQVGQVRTGWFCKIESYWWAPRLSDQTK